MKKVLLICAILVFAFNAKAQYSYTTAGAVYSQNFDGLPNAGIFTLSGKGPFNLSAAPVNATNISGWQIYMYAGSGSNAGFAFGTGSSTGQSVYSLGSSGSTDRALGTLASGTGIYAIGIVLTNNTGVTLNAFTVGFTAEQWRNGGSNTSNTWAFKYKTGAAIADINQAGFTSITNLNFSSAVSSASAGAINGNLSSDQTVKSYTVTGITWNNGEQLVLRWDDADESGSDDAMGIDNFSFAAYPSTNLYRWNGGASGSYNVSANWNPARSSISSNDILLFNSPGSTTIDNLPSETIASLIISGGANLTLQNSSTANAITINKYVNIVTGNSLVMGTNASISVASPGLINVNGNLTTNASVLLTSDNNGAAGLGTSTGTITGNIKVQRYVPGKRAFRFLSHPFSSSIALNSLTGNIDITGAGGSTNGFTNTGTNNASAYWYKTLSGNASQNPDPGWIAFANTNGTGNDAWLPYEGIRVLVRGNKGEGLDGNAYTPSSATLQMSGAVNMGDQVITLSKSANSDYNFVGNPYPSQVDLSLTTRGSNVGSNFWVWDIAQGLRGGYTSHAFSSSYILPSYSAFFVQSSSSTINNTIQFSETCKSVSVPAQTLFGGNDHPGNYLELRLESDSIFWDRLLFLFDDSAKAVTDLTDAPKLLNPDVNFYSLSQESNFLSIDARPLISTLTIPLGLQTYADRNFTIRVSDINLPPGVQMQLHDKYLDKWQQLDKNTRYEFNSTAADTGLVNNRFEITLAKWVMPVIDPPLEFTVKLGPIPCAEQLTVNYSSPVKAETSIRILTADGRILQTIHAGIQQQGQVTISVSGIASGIYLLEVICGDRKTIKKFNKL